MEANFNQDSEPTMHLVETRDNGIKIYDIDDTKEGMMAVRRAIDASFGRDSNPWCLVSRKHGVSDAVLKMFTPAQMAVYGLNDDDESLDAAWEFWRIYSAYPKQVAFRNGAIFAFSANSEDDLMWHDLNNESHKDLLDCII